MKWTPQKTQRIKGAQTHLLRDKSTDDTSKQTWEWEDPSKPKSGRQRTWPCTLVYLCPMWFVRWHCGTHHLFPFSSRQFQHIPLRTHHFPDEHSTKENTFTHHTHWGRMGLPLVSAALSLLKSLLNHVPEEKERKYFRIRNITVYQDNCRRCLGWEGSRCSLNITLSSFRLLFFWPPVSSLLPPYPFLSKSIPLLKVTSRWAHSSQPLAVLAVGSYGQQAVDISGGERKTTALCFLLSKKEPGTTAFHSSK